MWNVNDDEQMYYGPQVMTKLSWPLAMWIQQVKFHICMKIIFWLKIKVKHESFPVLSSLNNLLLMSESHICDTHTTL